jgi:hypothetical protein
MLFFKETRTGACSIGGCEMNNRIDRRTFFSSLGASALLGAWAASRARRTVQHRHHRTLAAPQWRLFPPAPSRATRPRGRCHRPTPTRASTSSSSSPCRLRRPMSRSTQQPAGCRPAPAAGKPHRLPDRAHPADHKIKPQFRRQLVRYNGPEQPGTIVIDTRQRFLYLVRGNGEALALRRRRRP